MTLWSRKQSHKRDGIRVGRIRTSPFSSDSVYDLVKIVGVGSKKINQSESTLAECWLVWFFCFCLCWLASCDFDNLAFTWSKAESERVFTLLVTNPTPSSVRMVTSTPKFLSTCGSAPYFLPFPPFLVDPPFDNQSKATKFPLFWRPVHRVSSRAGGPG